MQRLPILRFQVRLATTIRTTPIRLLPQIRRSSGSPTAGNAPPDHFTKTGEKEEDPAKINSRSNEYSQSGGDEMVAAQSNASFSGDVDPASQKDMAGKGNVVNPLELSPATPELSGSLEETVCETSCSGGREGNGMAV